MKLWLSLLICLITQVQGKNLLTGQWEYAELDGIPFAVYGKKTLDPNKKYPLVVGLHGMSNSNKNGSQTWIINEFRYPQRQEENPCILLAPLCYQPFGKTGLGWHDEPGEKTLKLTTAISTKLPVDPKRIYLVGYSMGGAGAVVLISKKPTLFAAGIIISGWADSSAIDAFKEVPTKVFHGAIDKIVRPHNMRKFAKKLEKEKLFSYTEFPKSGHNIKVRVLKDKGVIRWLFSQKK